MDPTRLPQVITIGAQKCGTTSLHNYLGAHPEIGVPRHKETRFFQVGGDPQLGHQGNWRRGVDWYRRQFPADRPIWVESFAGGYTDYPHEVGVAERIKSLIPAARFLYLVRDPIERLISHYVHDYSNSIESRSIEEAIADTRDNPYIDRGRYFLQLEQYLRVFPADRFLIIEHRDLRDRRRQTLAEVFRFVGAREDFCSDAFETVHHPSTQKRRNTAFGLMLQRTIGDRIFRHLRGAQRHYFKRIVYTPFSRPIARPVLSTETHRRLSEIFAPDLERLEQFIGRSLSHWLS